MKPQSGPEGVVTWLQFLGVAGYYLILPSLRTAGRPVPETLMTVCLGLFATATVVLLAHALLHSSNVNRVVILFLAYPTSYAAISAWKGDMNGVALGLITIALLFSLAVSNARLTFRVYFYGIAILVLVSVLLSASDGSFTAIGRTILPFIFDGRAFGFAGHPNTLGLLSGTLVVASITSIDRRSRPVALIGVLGLLSAASLTAVLSTFVAVSVVLAKRAFQKSGAFTATMMSIGFVAGALILFQSSERLEFASSGETFTGRTLIWDYLLQQDYGWLGIQSNTFAELLQTQFALGSAHNLYVEALLRTGVLGLMVVSASIVALLVSAIRNRNDRMIGIVSYLIISSITEGVLLALPFVLVFAVFSYAEPGNGDKRSDAPSSLRLRTGAAPPADLSS